MILKYWVFGLCEREYSRLPNRKHHTYSFFTSTPVSPDLKVNTIYQQNSSVCLFMFVYLVVRLFGSVVYLGV